MSIGALDHKWSEKIWSKWTDKLHQVLDHALHDNKTHSIVVIKDTRKVEKIEIPSDLRQQLEQAKLQEPNEEKLLSTVSLGQTKIGNTKQGYEKQDHIKLDTTTQDQTRQDCTKQDPSKEKHKKEYNTKRNYENQDDSKPDHSKQDCKNPDHRKKENTKRIKTKSSRSQPYPVPTPDCRTFLSIISQLAQEHMNDDAILHTLKSLVAPILEIPNKQQKLYRLLCIAETEGDLAGVTLLEFVTILNFPKVTTYLVKFIFKECFTHPADALPFFRHKDGEGNTLIHHVVAANGVAAITSLRVLMNVRYQMETCFVFEPTAVNKKGQHPLHLTMCNPVFQKEVFDVFNRLGMGILKCVDQAGNNLLHYALINHDGICKGISSNEDKASHMTDYLQAMLSFDDIKECVSKRNSNGQTPIDLVSSLENIEDLVRQSIRDKLSNVTYGKKCSSAEGQEFSIVSNNHEASSGKEEHFGDRDSHIDRRQKKRQKKEPVQSFDEETFMSQAKHPNFSKSTQLEGSSFDRPANDTSLISNSLNTSSDRVLSNTNDPSCGYDSFWQELSSLDPTANRYTTKNLNMNSLSKKWKHILRSLLPSDADGWIHSIQEIFGIEDMNHKMFTTFSILKKSITSGQLSVKLLVDKLYPILEETKKKLEDESPQIVQRSLDCLHEYSADEIILKNHTTLIKNLLPNLAIPIINALHKLYETDEKKAIATQFIFNRFCLRKYVSLEGIEHAKNLLHRYDFFNHNHNFAFANLYQPVYDVIIDRNLPENLKDKTTLKEEIIYALNSVKTNKRLRDWLIKIHDQRSYLYGWQKIGGSLNEEDFQSVSFEVLDIFYGNKVHFAFKFITFKMEEPSQDDRCRLEKLNNVYRIALENIGDIMTNSNTIRFENHTVHISIMSELKADVETIVVDQLRDIWGRACTDESYRDKLLLKLKDEFPDGNIPYSTTEDILSLFKNEHYGDQDVDRLQIEFKKSPEEAKVTLADGYVLWPKLTRRLSELPNEWFTEFYSTFMDFIPVKFYKSVARNFIKNASIYKKGNNCLILMKEALNFQTEDNLLELFDHFRKNGGTVGDLRLALEECKTNDINLNSTLNQEKNLQVETLIKNIDCLVEDTYKNWKSRFETKLPGKITTRKVFENFFKQYGISQMPKMNVPEFYQKLESGEIHKGDQIWLWRNGFLTDSYAHVGIFVDEESITDSNQVRDDLPPQKSIVHVTPRERAKLRHISRQEQSRIKCDSVQNAVHTNDEIFVVRYEGNTDFSGEEIAKRALACCKPKITFKYNGYYGSCETFASKICGSTSVEKLNMQGFQVAFQGGKKEAIADFLHKEERFDDLIRQVDSRMMAFSRDSAEPMEINFGIE